VDVCGCLYSQDESKSKWDR